jgi:hypothetical protein
VAFEKGNKLGAKAKLFSQALHRVVTQNPEQIRKAAEALVNAAAGGDLKAISELADRLDGKAHQTVTADVEHTVNTGDGSILAQKLEHALATREKPTVQ